MQPHGSIDQQEPITLPEPTRIPPRIPLRVIGTGAATLPHEITMMGALYTAFQITAPVSSSTFRRMDLLTCEMSLDRGHMFATTALYRGELIVVRAPEGDVEYWAAHAGFTVRRSDEIVGRVVAVSREVSWSPAGLPVEIVDPPAALRGQQLKDEVGGWALDQAIQLDDPQGGSSQPAGDGVA